MMLLQHQRQIIERIGPNIIPTMPIKCSRDMPGPTEDKIPENCKNQNNPTMAIDAPKTKPASRENKGFSCGFALFRSRFRHTKLTVMPIIKNKKSIRYLHNAARRAALYRVLLACLLADI